MWRKIKLAEEGKRIIWSDNWCFDNGDIWFVAGEMNILFCIKENEIFYVSKIPSETVCEFRKNPRCIKKDNIIFCFPDEGNIIWSYYLERKVWTNINLENPNKVRLSCSYICTLENKLYILSNGLKKIIELNTNIQKVNKYYDLQVKEISGSVVVGKKIYIIDSILNSIIKFDCLDKSMTKYLLPEINDYIKTISFDGNKFWMSGRKKKIYIWKENINQITIIDTFPSDFGVYNFSGKYPKLLNYEDNIMDVPLFLYSVVAGSYIWFIPFQTNQILYTEKNNYRINKFIIKDEEQTSENIKRQFMGHKFILEYVKENRYIGIFSLKNGWIFEIDAKNLTYKIIKYRLNKNSASEILVEIFKDNSLFLEQEKKDLSYLIECILLLKYNRTSLLCKKSECSIGENIFLKLK